MGCKGGLTVDIDFDVVDDDDDDDNDDDDDDIDDEAVVLEETLAWFCDEGVFLFSMSASMISVSGSSGAQSIRR
jgi:hypothetical protein